MFRHTSVTLAGRDTVVYEIVDDFHGEFRNERIETDAEAIRGYVFCERDARLLDASTKILGALTQAEYRLGRVIRSGKGSDTVVEVHRILQDAIEAFESADPSPDKGRCLSA